MFSSEDEQEREDIYLLCSLARKGVWWCREKKSSALLADLGCPELNALTPTYFSGSHRQAQIKEGKTKRKETGARKEEPTIKHHLQRTLDTVTVIL